MTDKNYINLLDANKGGELKRVNIDKIKIENIGTSWLDEFGSKSKNDIKEDILKKGEIEVLSYDEENGNRFTSKDGLIISIDENYIDNNN